ncbi:MAG: C_GCAxxG_C_C family protein, partial [Clostridiales bacterium]|nr:C_GCAxxG_C_C family protein [Clostridiales bacterium]
MDDFLMRLMELSSQGFFCSQILLMLRLEAEGKQNPDLVRALGGLAGGLGFSGKTCGALTGGACLIAYYAGKGAPDERAD